MPYPILAEIFKDFISLFFPRYCRGCSSSLIKGEDVVCTRCMLEMPQTHYHTFTENPLRDRISLRIRAKYVIALYRFSKNGRIQHLLHALKYQNMPEIGVSLGRVYGDKLKQAGFGRQFDLIVPVPLHAARKRKRGYNQSAMFAQGLAEKLEISFSDDLLQRVRKTETQTRKTKLSRWQNVDHVFTIRNPSSIYGKRVLLVDDVVTTGATLEACGSVLIQGGCSELSIACIAEA